MRIRNVTRDAELADYAVVPRGWWSRMVGLLGRSSLRPGEALVLRACNSVHTAFMRFAIDIVYVDKAERVVKVRPDMKPFRVSGVLRPGCSVIELPTGTVSATGTAPGDQLVFEP